MKGRNHRSACGLLLSASTLALLIATPANAQQQPGAGDITSGSSSPNASAAPASPSGQLEEIVVTAQRRSQNLQNVPVAIAAISSETVKEQGYTKIENIGTFVPSVTFQTGNSAQGNTINIRGIGTTGSNFGFEQAVPTFIDGIVHGHPEQVTVGFFDVDRIEILKGPQPVFFGQNATAGAISITSRKPGSHWSADFTGEQANFNSQNIEAAVGGPVSSTLGVRVAGKYVHSDGFAYDQAGNPGPFSRAFAGRVTAVWKPTSNFDVTAKFEFSRWKGDTIPQQYVGCAVRAASACGALLPGDTHFTGTSLVEDDQLNRTFGSGAYLAPPPTLFQSQTISSKAPLMNMTQCAACNDFHRWINTTDAMIEANYHFGDNGPTLTSLSGWSYMNRDFLDDNDASPFALQSSGRGENPRQLSEELRLTSPTGGFFEWMIGAYYQHIYNPNHSDGFQTTISSFPQGEYAWEKDRWLSGFFAFTFNVGNFSLDTGGRYSDVDKTGHAEGRRANYIIANNGPQVAGAVITGITPFVLGLPRPGPLTVDGTFHDSDFNPQVVLRYHPSDDLSFYAKYTTAFKAGGFQFATNQIEPADQFTFGSEHGKSYEAGIKSTLLDHKLSLNLAIFREDYKDLQLSSLDPRTVTNVVSNVGRARSQGVEFDGRARLSSRFNLTFALTRLDAKIRAYPNATCNITEINTNACPDPINQTIDRTGQRLTFAPKWAGSAGFEYWAPVRAGYRVKINGDFAATSSYLTDDNYDVDVHMPFNTHINLRVSYGPEDGKWDIGLFGRNLTAPNQKWYGIPTNSGTNVQKYAVLPGVSYGVQVSFHF